MRRTILLIIILILFGKNITLAYNNKFDLQYLFVESYYQKNFGNLSQSVYFLNQLINKDSTCGACYYLLSQIYDEVNDIKTALKYANKAYIIDSSNYWYLKNYLNILFKENNTKNVIYPLLYQLKINNKSTLDDKLFIIKTYLENNDSIEKILYLLNDLEKTYGLNSEIYFYKILYYKYTNSKKYLIYLKKGKEIYNDNEKIISEYCDYLINQKKYNNVVKLINSYLKKNKLSSTLYAKKLLADYKLSKKIFYNEISNLSKNSQISYNDKKDIIINFFEEINKKIYKNVIKNVKNLTETINDEQLYNYLTDLSLKYFDYENFLYFSSIFKEKYSTNSIAWSKFIYGLFLNQRYDEIYSLLKKNNEYFKAPLISYIAGFILNLKKEEDKAIPYLIRSINVSENFGYKSFAVEIIAQYYYKRNLYDSAFYYYEKSIKNNYANDIILNNYAYFLAQQEKDLYKAAGLSLKSLSNDKKNPSFLDTYAWIVYKLENYELAYKYIKLAKKYSREKNNEILEHYALIEYCIKKNLKKTIRMLQYVYNDDKLIDLKLKQTKCY